MPGGRMTTILLINPNTSARSLEMMSRIAAPMLPAGVVLRGVSAAAGVAMIVNEADLVASAQEVVRLGIECQREVAAIVVAAFGDPGVAALRAAVRVPVVGIGAASFAEAAASGRRFGIATTTPGLVGPIEALVERLSFGAHFTGVRVPDGDPLLLAADASRQEEALAQLVRDCIEIDGAEAVIIGGGPLSMAASALRRRFATDIVEPVPAAIRYAARLLGFQASPSAM
jgi:allantoin racemase